MDGLRRSDEGYRFRILHIGLQIAVYSRVLSSQQDWYKDFTMEPSTSSEINLTLDLAGIHEALQDMNFYELKGLI